MKALLIVATVAFASIGFAADAAHTAPAAPAAQEAAPNTAAGTSAPAQPMMHAKGKHAMASKETIKKCKAEHKGDKKAYMECLKAAN